MHGEDRRRMMVAEARVKELEAGIDLLIKLYDNAAADGLCGGSSTEMHIWQAVVRDVKRLKRGELTQALEEEVCHCGQECRCHTQMGGHTAVPMENYPAAWELLNRAAKRLPKVEDADLRRLLTNVINATRRAVEFEPEGLLTEATDKYILGRKSQFLPTDKYLQECAERLHDKVCFLKTCDWHTSTWDEPKYERKRYLAYAFRVLMLGIDIDDACRVLHIWREEI